MHIHDQIGRTIELKGYPKSIVSLVPSITQTLLDWGLKDKVKGVTSFCPNPNKSIAIIGGTKTVKPESIRALQPDLILANKEENTRKIIDELSRDTAVYVSDIHSMEDALNMLTDLGHMTHQRKKSDNLIQEILKQFRSFQSENQIGKPGVIYFIWRNPFMIAGGGTFIDDMIERAGFTNLGREIGDRYPVVEHAEIQNLKPEFLFLSSEPYRFTETHAMEWEEFIPLENIVMVDARYFSWYGSQLRESAKYFSGLCKKLSIYMS